ncbi:MAG: hypothetical protein Fur0041_05510 [Bacteroidia bacterium]
MRSFFAFSILIVFFYSSCKGDKQPVNTDSISASGTKAPADSAAVLIAPSPLQSISVIRQLQHKADYRLLSDINIETGSFTTEYRKALLLGVIITDAAYSGIAGNYNLASGYFKKGEKLIRELKLESSGLKYFSKFNETIRNKDSLAFHLLSFYNDIQQELNSGKREKTGLALMTGAMVESMTLSLADSTLYKNEMLLQLAGQQKIWVNNLLTAVTYLPNEEETQDMYNTLYTFSYFFEPVTASVVNKKSVVVAPPDALKKLNSKATQIREEILRTK